MTKKAKYATLGVALAFLAVLTNVFFPTTPTYALSQSECEEKNGPFSVYIPKTEECATVRNSFDCLRWISYGFTWMNGTCLYTGTESNSNNTIDTPPHSRDDALVFFGGIWDNGTAEDWTNNDDNYSHCHKYISTDDKTNWVECVTNKWLETPPHDEGTREYYEWLWDEDLARGQSYQGSPCSQYYHDTKNKNLWVQCQMNFYKTDIDPNPDTGDCGKRFLTFRPWFNHLCIMDTDGKGGNIISPSRLDGGLTAFVWIIVLNIIAILLQLVGYVSVGFIIWGGFQYVLAQGEPAKLTAAQKTIINAVIGLVIAIFANIIINTIVHFITQGQGVKV